MAKEVQMSIKIEPDLCDRFVASETPNAFTAETLRKSGAREDVFHASSASDLFKQLDI